MTIFYKKRQKELKKMKEDIARIEWKMESVSRSIKHWEYQQRQHPNSDFYSAEIKALKTQFRSLYNLRESKLNQIAFNA